MKVKFGTSIDNQLLTEFRSKCKSDGITIGSALEALMVLYVQNQVEIETSVTINSRDGL